MSKTTINVTAITFDKVKSKKLSFYLNGKISNTEKIDNILVSNEIIKENSIFALSENFECKIEQSNTLISQMKEIKKYHSKLQTESFDEISLGLENCIKGTYDFIYGIEGDDQLEFSNDKLVTSVLINENNAKFISTSYDSLYYISNNEVSNIFSRDNINNIIEDENEEENDYAPSSGVIKSFVVNDIKKNDIFVFCTKNINDNIDNDIVSNNCKDEYSTEEIAWNLINNVSSKDIIDELIVVVIKILDIDENKIVNKQPKSKFLGLFGNENKKREVENEVIEDKTDEDDFEEDDEEEDNHKKSVFDKDEKEEKKLYNEYAKVNIQKPNRLKKRMNIYLKRIISLVIVVVLLAGIVWGMVKLFKLIINNGNVVEVPAQTSIIPVEVPDISESPTPTPTPTPTPEPTPTPTQELYNEYTIQPGDSLSKISTMFYGSSAYVDDIVVYNDNLSDKNVISVGQKIKIPFLNTAPTPSGPSPSPDNN